MVIKLNKKIFIILILTILINVLLIPTINYANDSEKKLTEMANPITNPEAYAPEEQQVETSHVTNKLTAKIVSWLRNIGVIIGVLVLTIIGFKYMLASGADEKAQYKETLVPIVIGVVMLLGSISLITAIAGLFD